VAYKNIILILIANKRVKKIIIIDDFGERNVK
jgi:hypothetical protein